MTTDINRAEAESTVAFHDSEESLSATLIDVAASLHGDAVTLREILMLLGEQGLLVFCVFLTLPFLIPISIPGVSTVFGAVIILLGVGITLNRVPWLPARLMHRPFHVSRLVPLLHGGANFVKRFDRLTHPRLSYLTGTALVNRVHGFALTFGAFLLIFPFGFIPLSNTLPALAILFLALGILQRDGWFIAGGYAMLLVTMVYFGVLILGALAGGQALGSLLSG
ncbi:MAG: exopolysaccharide biosynthesis protein [Chloroflexi bacterium]|nr:exopolysaccharide biosynthesis protein [Chloroflexota bacterium]